MIRQFYILCISILLMNVMAMAQDNCAGALTLCAGSSRNSNTTGATTVGSDPALSCGDGVVSNSVWFTLLAISNGNATVTVNNINNNPGLEMEIYTGSCGALVSTGLCTSGSSGTGGTMNISFATVSGTTYYIMVDGSGGNQEAFDIVATTPNNAIVARPDANFSPSAFAGCTPLTVNFTNTTQLQGGSNITYEWRVDAGSFVPAPALVDTTITFSTIGTHTVTLRVCNQECGCKTVSQDIDVQDLFPTISYLPTSGCVGTEIFFDGAASIQPDPPFVDPNITSWDWDFGDPASGAANTASGQSVSHTFTNSSTSYNVSLTVQGVCGPKTVNTTVNLNPQPVVTITGASDICEGEDLSLGSTVANTTGPVIYDWVGVGSFSCTNCPSTIVSGLPAGGPYTITLSIEDSLGCVADTSVDVNVNEIPVVFAGGFITVCANDSAQLNAVPSLGTPPYSYLWTPAAGLSNDTIFDPIAYNTNNATYCVTVTDSLGCESLPDCVTVDQYPIPTINPGSANLCATQTPVQNTFTVNGASPGSTYEWGLSPDYALITGAAPDSSSIDVTFPSVAGSYDFTAIVSDAVTGCIDTVSTSFTVDTGLNMNISGPSDICDGESATLTASGATAYAWEANPVYAFADSTLATQNVSPSVTTTFTVTGTQGTCTQVLTHVLNVNPIPVPFINPLAEICGCDTVSLDGTGSTPAMNYLWSSASGSLINAPTNLITTAYACVNDVITLTVTDPGTGCADSITDAIVSRPKPNAVASVSPDLICNGVATAIALDGTGSNTDPGTVYHWSSSNGSVIADTTAIITSSNVSSATVFTLTVTDSLGCDSTTSDAVNIHPPPTFSANPPFLCTTDPILESTLTISSASPTTNYNWTTIPGCVIPTTANSASQIFDFSLCGAGVYNFDVEVTDSATTCVTNLSQTVTVVNGVTLVVSNDTTFCEGGTATLSASGANSFIWSPTGDTTATINVSGLTAAGSPHTLTVIGIVGGCSDTATIQVTVNPIPATAWILPIDTSVCENDPASVYSVTPGGAGSTFNWSITGGVILVGQGTPDVVVSWGAPGLGQLSVIETNSFGCDGPLISLQFLINPLPPAPVITGPDTVCADAVATYFVAPSAGSTYTWSIAGGSFVTGSTGSVNTFQWGASGSGSLDVYETTAAGCIGPATNYPVLINPRPSMPIITGNSVVCDNVIEVYTVPPGPDSIYTWTVANSLSDTVNSGMDSLTVNWASGSTIGLITVFETNTFGCNSDTASLNIAIALHPVVNVTNGSDSVCNNAPYQLVANISGGSIQWSTSGTGTFSNDTVASPVYYPSVNDTGSITLSVVSSYPPCADAVDSVTVFFLPSPVVTVSGPAAPICYGTQVVLSATGGGTYLWTPGGIPNDSISVRPLVTTTYTVAVTNGVGCTTIDSVTVDVIPPGIPDAGPDAGICIDDSLSLSGSQINATGLVWSTLGDGVFIPDTTSGTVTYIPGTNDTTNSSVIILLTTTGACLNLTDSVLVTISRYAIINAGNDTTVTSDPTAGASIPLSPTGMNITGVQWSTSGSGTFVPSDTSINAVYEPSPADFESGSVMLFVATTGNCFPAIDTLIIDFSPFVFPNVFTPYPASPGFNDFFVIKYLTDNVALKIWDRWGKLVYTSDYYQNDWDAYGLKADVYYYVVVAESKQYKGWVQVIREE